MMNVEFNTNIKILMGGHFCGNTTWNKDSTNIDNCFKIYHIEKGEAEIVGKYHTSKLKAGKIYFLNGYNLQSQKCLETLVVDWVHFLPKSLYFDYILKLAPCVIGLPEKDLSSMLQIFEKFRSYFSTELTKSESRITQLEIQALIYFVISKVFASFNADQLLGNEKLQRLLPALDFISENYRNSISLYQLAETCHLSPNYFHRIFTGIFKVSPLNYIRSLRIDEAMRQLAYTNKPIKDIAFNVGYDDEAYFTRVFSKLYGYSPTNYRKQYVKAKP